MNHQTNHHNLHYLTKYKLDTAVAIMFIFIGASIVNVVFGMLLFPVLTRVCANELLLGVARIGYAGIVTLAVGLFLEAYNLYELHKRHIAVIVAVTIIMATVAALLIHFVAQAYTCSL
ncbi:MAG: hypothetical protein ACD_43C00168G0002 [uncultured bacterium]|nr:MAG: hypothetical protein ACD_43C00168G0002 [uncultured bacterium]